jgi:hypothetical protein
MSDDPREAIRDALTNPDAATALEALRLAAGWAVQAIPAEVGEDDVRAFEYVAALDDGIEPVAVLMRLAPELVQLASPGQQVSHRLAAAEVEFRRQQEALSADRAKLTAARDLEHQIREQEAEREQLRTELEELEHRRRVVEELPMLRSLRDELKSAFTRVQESEGDKVIRELCAAAGLLLALTEEQRSLLDSGNGRLERDLTAAVEAATREQARHTTLTEELRAREQEASRLRTAAERELPGLQARRRADHDLALGLTAAGLPSGESSLGQIRAELQQAERRLDAAEEHLRPLLREHLEAYEKARQLRQ